MPPTPRPPTLPVVARAVPQAPAQPIISLDRLADIALREALNATRTVRIYGKDYLNANSAGWKNRDGHVVSVAVEVVQGGPLGATIMVNGFPIPADMPGARSAFTALESNEDVTIVCSHAAIIARLLIKTPRAPLGR